jgi:hypothetical protein
MDVPLVLLKSRSVRIGEKCPVSIPLQLDKTVYVRSTRFTFLLRQKAFFGTVRLPKGILRNNSSSLSRSKVFFPFCSIID